jgi:hypothetical protein
MMSWHSHISESSWNHGGTYDKETVTTVPAFPPATLLLFLPGAGVVLPTPFGSFELNYCWVLTHQERDRLKQGLQLGFAAGGTVGRHGCM